MKKNFILLLLVIITLLAACAEPDSGNDSSLFDVSSGTVSVNSSAAASSSHSSSAREEESSADIPHTSSAGESSSIPPESSDPPESSGPVQTNEPYLVNGVLIVGTRAIEQYGGGVKSAAAFAGYMNDFAKALGSGVRLYSMPAPTASYYYSPPGYTSFVTNHEKTFASLRDNLAGVTDVNLMPVLAKHTGEEIYFRTEHHWTALAGYYAAQAFAAAAGTPFADISTFTEKYHEGFLGSFYSTYTHEQVLKDNPERLYYYLPSQEYKCYYCSRENFSNPKEGRMIIESSRSYSMFIQGDSYSVRIETGLETGRKLLLIKDSFGITLSPFLIGSFDEVFVIDSRYYKLNATDLVKDNGITDVCVALSSFGIVGDSGKKIKNYA